MLKIMTQECWYVRIAPNGAVVACERQHITGKPAITADNTPA